MGPNCPKCSTPLKEDYGMVTCHRCGAIVFVDMDGNAQVAGNEPVDLSPIDSQPVDPAPVGLPPMDFGSSQDPPGALAGSDLPAFDAFGNESLNEPPPTAQTPPRNQVVAPEAVPQQPEPDSADLDMNAFLGYDSDTPKVDPSHDDPADPLGISAYANSEMSSAKDGPLVVTLIVSGIDAKDIRDEIRQALQDSRFGWDTSALMTSIKKGVLRLPKISPVKATIVINRIKNLAVQIHWEQSAITEIDPTSDSDCSADPTT